MLMFVDTIGHSMMICCDAVHQSQEVAMKVLYRDHVVPLAGKQPNVVQLETTRPRYVSLRC